MDDFAVNFSQIACSGQTEMEARHSTLTSGLATEKSFSLEPLLKEAQKLLRKPIKDLR